MLDEYVSIGGAEADYGVVLNGSSEDLSVAVDHEATKELRDTRRGAA